MNKIKLIIAREYLTRVKKKSFIVMTLVVPILLASIMVVPVVVSMKAQKHIKVIVVDDNDFYINSFRNTKKIDFSYRSGNIKDIQTEIFEKKNADAVLHILNNHYQPKANLYSKEEIPYLLRNNIEDQMNKLFFDKVLQDTFQINPRKFEQIKSFAKVDVAMVLLDDFGDIKKNVAGESYIIGIVLGVLIYLIIFTFSSQVLRSVLEEKTNRIVEVLLSSVKPIQLLVGKILGVALVCLTQFVLWIVFTGVIVLIVNLSNPQFLQSEELTSTLATTGMSYPQTLGSDASISPTGSGMDIYTLLESFFGISILQILGAFLFYLIFGYLLYSALFASLGSAVDNDTDSNQFTFPFTLPLLLTMMLIVPISQDPSGSLAFWISMIPFTSPVGMLIRLPSGVPVWQLLTSMGILLLFLVFCLWLSAKIYRTGILMYGKKITYKDLGRWIRS